MKRIAIGIICFVIGFVGTSLILNTGKQYSREAYVETNTQEKITFNDAYGHKWELAIKEETEEEIKTLSKGEKVILTFDTKGTYDFVDDDILKKVEKKG